MATARPGALPVTRALPRTAVTGLVLAGGRGSRMGGVDKGLQPWHGRALVDHVLERFAPQVGPVALSANRHVDEYARRGWPVLADATPDFDGPLAGLLAGLRHATTPWLAVVPCDAPRLPADLVARLAAGLDDLARDAGAFVTRPDDRAPASPAAPTRHEPLFCLLRNGPGVAEDLADALARGERKVDRWLLARGLRPVPFDRPGDEAAFANFNRLDDLA